MMSTAENPINTTTPVAVPCGACGQTNGAESKFCNGCGQSLYEPCRGCNQSVMLTQKFCGSCGADLDAALRKRRAQCKEKIAESVAAAKECDFEHADVLLHEVAKITDYRFAELANTANKAIKKLQEARKREEASAHSAVSAANLMIEQGNQAEAVELLESIPARMMSDEAKQTLARVRTHTDQVVSRKEELRAAIAERNWTLVGGLIDQLLVLAPEDETYRQLAERASVKLMAAAKQLLQKGSYALAAEQLESVPEIGRTEKFMSLRDSVDNIHWLSNQFDQEPFASSALGRLAVRFAKEVPSDGSAQKLVKKLAATLRNAPRPRRSHLPRWKESAPSWMGGATGVLGLPVSVEIGDDSGISTAAGRFNVAIGLAIQGLGRGRVTEQFAHRKRLLPSFGRRKKKSCWGIDVGTATFKAVRMDDDGDNLSISDCYFAEFETPLNRASETEDTTGIVRNAIEKFLAEKDVEKTEVWANLSASRMVTRFVRLPPLDDKRARQLLDKEIGQKFPIPLDELAIVRWIQDQRESDAGRPAIVMATRKQLIESRLELLEDCGLSITGLQVDSLALVNFAAHEFAEHWSADDQDSTKEPLLQNERLPAVVLVDAGALSINLVIVSEEAHWVATLEAGGEDLTRVIARATKKTREEAESLKRDPAELTRPFRQYTQVQQKLDELRFRLETGFAEAKKQNSRFDVVETWCMGGGCLTHQWIRRVMLEKNDSD